HGDSAAVHGHGHSRESRAAAARGRDRPHPQKRRSVFETPSHAPGDGENNWWMMSLLDVPLPRKGEGEARWIYRQLFRNFGPRGWWPVTPAGRSAAIYHRRNTRGRLSESQKFEVALGAFLTQNTAWTNVEKALAALRRRRLHSVAALARASRRQI